MAKSWQYIISKVWQLYTKLSKSWEKYKNNNSKSEWQLCHLSSPIHEDHQVVVLSYLSFSSLHARRHFLAHSGCTTCTYVKRPKKEEALGFTHELWQTDKCVTIHIWLCTCNPVYWAQPQQTEETTQWLFSWVHSTPVPMATWPSCPSIFAVWVFTCLSSLLSCRLYITL